MTTTEIWKPVVGCEGAYEVSNHGRVRSLERTIKRRYRGGFRFQPVKAAVLQPTLSRYLIVALVGKKLRTVHSLVLEAFVGPRPTGYEGLHGDGNRMNNHLSNLRWGTSKENKEDAIRHGVWVHGEKCGSSKLDDQKVGAIRSSKETLEYFGRKFGVSDSAISDVRNYKTWRHLP